MAANTIRGWIKEWKRRGLRGLVDGRKTRGRQGFEVIDPRFVRIADEEFAQFDGTRSKVNLVEIERRILVRLKQDGIDDLNLPERITQQYLSTRMAALGVTTRQHKSAVLRRNSSRSNYPATHPGHFAVDVTRADNLVWDDVYERVYSVEIITIISVPSRVVVACRVVPRSANALEVALALYDAMRPFSMVMENETSIDDFRWCGIPASLDFGDNPVSAHISGSSPTARSSAVTSSPGSPRCRCAQTTGPSSSAESCAHCCSNGGRPDALTRRPAPGQHHRGALARPVAGGLQVLRQRCRLQRSCRP